jgi:hypothetical protein
MARAGSKTTLEMDELVSTYADRQAGISWPLPVDAKLEHLLQLARSVGEPTSRREIAACILALAEVMSPEHLSTMLRDYRRMKVRQMPSASNDSNVVEFRPHGPGPRRRQA